MKFVNNKTTTFLIDDLLLFANYNYIVTYELVEFEILPRKIRIQESYPS